MDNKMDNELDFRVGDVVCDIRYGTGKVEGIETGRNWPVCVNFGKSESRLYKFDGRYIDDDKYRSLYHGTLEQVFGNLPDLKPKRKVKRWVNLYTTGQWDLFESKEKAELLCCADAVAKAVEIEVDE